ncbi:MAG: hydroxymethylglutaryl-CoA reductase, degradative [Planctomycetes bacterium]|nr:hydroxymethylglutaryl-CoA reductase, degradative [Planctomycetota bacterium]
MTSRFKGFYKLPAGERIRKLLENVSVSEAGALFLESGGGLDLSLADKISENVISVLGLPLSVALNFVIDSREVLVPMAVEEPSIVAGASKAALIVRAAGGFVTRASDPVMTAQVQVYDVANHSAAKVALESAENEIVLLANAAIPSMVSRGGGARSIEIRDLKEGMVVTHIYVDCRDAMGANVADSVAEAVAPRIAQIAGGKVGLRILSNLPLNRMVKASAKIPVSAFNSPEVAKGVAMASRFAELDVYRAVTHNKGIMNGIDAVAVACGQDFRSIEAAAHGFAGMGEGYRPLSSWRIEDSGEGAHLVGELELPLAAGIVGGSTQATPGARLCLELVGAKTSRELASVIASAGLAANLASLLALSTEGIQRGHMRLHSRKKSTPG